MIQNDNFEILERFAETLTHNARFVAEKEVHALTENGRLDSEKAMQFLLAAECMLDLENNPNDRNLFHRYFESSVRKLEPSVFESDSYYQFLRERRFAAPRWELTWNEYAPYQIFVRNDIMVTDEFYEIPRLGFFERSYSYPAVLQDGREWMTLTPNEAATMSGALNACGGRIVTYGLGLGYFAFKAAEKNSTESVTVIEQDPELIALFKKHILRDIPFGGKIRIIQSDAFEYAGKEASKEHFDFAFVDLWHDLGDGVVPYIRMKKQEQQRPETMWFYWIEATLLSHLRWALLAEFKKALIKDAKIAVQQPVKSFDDIRFCLTDEYLKQYAGCIKLTT